LNFDLLTPKGDHVIPLPHGPLVPICSKIATFLLKYSGHKIDTGRTNKWSAREHYASWQSI